MFAISGMFLLWFAFYIYGSLPLKAEEDTGSRARSESLEQALAEQPDAFLSDEVVGGTLMYRALQYSYWWACWFHSLELQGLENLPPPGKGALLISTHTTHNMDISMGLTGIHAKTGRVPRGLMHRAVFTLFPWLKYLGLVPGQRYTAKHLIHFGFLTCVLPGGGEEAMRGHENAYSLHPIWKKRRGFAHVAIDAGADIIPVFIRNVEEMRFNPFFFCWNRAGLSRRYQELIDWLEPRSRFLNSVVRQVGFWAWLTLSFWAVPVPVKLTIIFGEPVSVRKQDSADNVAERSSAALEAMITDHQPHGHEYATGLRERFARSKRE